MIGKFLNAGILTPEQEDAVLTEKLGHAPRWVRNDGCRCLIGVAYDYRQTLKGRLLNFTESQIEQPEEHSDLILDVALQFDELCLRFGDLRVGRVIRDRILSLKASRELATVRATAGV